MIALVVIVQYFFYLKATRYFKSIHESAMLRRATKVAFILFNAPMLAMTLWRPDMSAVPPLVMSIGVYPFYVWHYSLILLFLFIVAGKILQFPFISAAWVWQRVFRAGSGRRKNDSLMVDSGRRKLLGQGMVLLTGAIFATTTIGIVRRNRWELSCVEIPMVNLPDEFSGFTICLLSDIHSSIFMTKGQMQEYADAANELGTDLIVVTGDFVNSAVDEIYPFAEAFSGLSAPFGSYGVLGNHDYFARNIDIISREVNSCGVRLLRNEHVILERKGKKVCLLGLDDVGNERTARRFIDKAMATTDRNIPKLLLCHRPYFFQQAADRNIALMLSGHTHGGQIVFTQIGRDIIAPARMVSPYVAGLYSKGSSHMYVSRGIGTVGVPLRLNCPPELTKITLVAA